MGWERKRGKLAEFNRLLRGATDTSFSVLHGDLSVLPSIRYAITLDSDTRLPMEAGRRLVGALAHPLNRPRFDARLGRVTEGYGILQPRVQVSVESATRTAFAQVFAGHVGVDPYTTAVSDVYQDLFHEGSFIGKGIYDVDAFLAALAGRVPEHTLLSHDLFEGFYARAGLCTDIELVDDYPSNYLAFAARMHRWVRGDWQIARWLARTVPTESGAVVRNTLPVIARWKILDNLRRSLIAPALVALFVAGWTVLPGSALLWSTLAILVLAFPAYVQIGRSLGSRFRGVPLREHFLAERDNLATSARQAFLSTVFLLHLSGVMLDAIGRTLFRLLVTRRRLLEWVTADRSAHVEASAADVSRQMPGTLVTPALIAIALGLIAPVRLPLAAPILVLWCLSPAIAYATGRPLKAYVASLSRAERAAFRRTRAQDLALLRRVRRTRRSLAGPRQHPGKPPRPRRPPHLADQHRLAAPLDARGPRLRLHHARRPAEPARADLCHPAADATVSRPLLQLVRHANARRARAGLHLDGRQRQSRRRSGDVARRPDRAHRGRADRRPVVPARARGPRRPGRRRAGASR